MAVLARSWFHFCTAIGWFLAAPNRVLLTAVENQVPKANFNHQNDIQGPCWCRRPGQFRPLGASQSDRSVQLMVLVDDSGQINHGQSVLLRWIPSNSSSQARPSDGPCDTSWSL